MVEAATPFVVNYMKFIQNNGEFAAAEACVTTSCVAEVQPKIDDFKVDESFRRAKLEEYYKIQQSSKKQVIGYFTGCVLGGTAAAAVALDDNVAASR
jgi:outer membrane lipoprotein SlyB